MSERTPAELRSAARATLARVLSRVLVAVGVSQLDLAEACGTKAQKVQLWCDAKRPETPYVADLPQMQRGVAMELLRWAADQHGALVVDRVDAAGDACRLGVLAAVLKEHGEAVAAYTDLLAHGATPAALERAITEVREAQAQLGKLLSMMERELAAMNPKLRPVRGGAA